MKLPYSKRIAFCSLTNLNFPMPKITFVSEFYFRSLSSKRIRSQPEDCPTRFTASFSISKVKSVAIVTIRSTGKKS